MTDDDTVFVSLADKLALLPELEKTVQATLLFAHDAELHDDRLEERPQRDAMVKLFEYLEPAGVQGGMTLVTTLLDFVTFADAYCERVLGRARGELISAVFAELAREYRNDL